MDRPLGGGSTLIGLKSDMELSKGEKEKDFDRPYYSPASKVHILVVVAISN